ncbi:hypothetical protein RvY_07502 [Ramazzottius varieornatus]|uniref:Uncharacterized protein n=1 Tax=Ramazzottius varieornatus TaxID=947166 RepID=A0A1D1V2N1_RAMVA|nr:hypothetical protein RvY_07502 [Ramazzottius varieornatus]
MPIPKRRMSFKKAIGMVPADSTEIVLEEDLHGRNVITSASSTDLELSQKVHISSDYRHTRLDLWSPLFQQYFVQSLKVSSGLFVGMFGSLCESSYSMSARRFSSGGSNRKFTNTGHASA